MNNLHVKKGDTVMVISGSEAQGRDNQGKKIAKTGKVLFVSPKAGTVIVEGINKRFRHQKPRGAQNPGGRIEREMPISASRVMLYCTKCNKPTRIKHAVADNGRKYRVCKHCGNDLG